MCLIQYTHTGYKGYFKKNDIVFEIKASKCFLLGKAQACSLFKQYFFTNCMFIFVQESGQCSI